MRRMAEAKERYDNIPIPEELSERIMLEVKRAEKKHGKKLVKSRRNSFLKTAGAAAAAAAVLFTVSVNTSEAFAKEISSIPVIGSLAKIVTFRSYESETEDLKISVEIPSVEMIAEELKGLEDEVNEEIYGFCKQYADEAVKRAEEYRQAFLDTGGTQEEWEEHHIAIKVWYEVKSQSDRYLSLAVMGSENWTGAYSETKYYNLDMEQGKWINLADLLGEDFEQIATESILAQIGAREQETGMEFWTSDWTGVGENTGFYINQAGNPVVVLEKYEIAPGAAGEQEFEIMPGEVSGKKPGEVPGKEQEAEPGAASGKEQEAAGQQEEKTIYYEDNFAVDEEAFAGFAKAIQETVARGDLEGLADLTGFPVYVGLPEEGVVVETREDFLALGGERLLTEEMRASIADTDISGLSPSMAGFTMYGQEGAPSITFGVREGILAISGINY